MPIIVVTGPRQSGKTTLVRATFKEHAYVNLEPLDVREYAMDDPRGFLEDYPPPLILDEVQNAPTLLSYIQPRVDEQPIPGQYVLTGSHQLGLTRAIQQSLAGRAELLNLLPLAIDELPHVDENDPWTTIFRGGYPRIHDQHLDPSRWLADYVTTYVQRDVADVLDVRDRSTFATFLRLLAGRVAQERNLSSLASDVGVTYPTIGAWSSVLEASFVTFLAPAWFANHRKRFVKSPKIHFVDSGLACHLLGIRSEDQLSTHPLRGAIFESWVASEIWKWRLHRGLPPDLFHVRRVRGAEVDLWIDAKRERIPVEVKSARTLSRALLDETQRKTQGLISEEAAVAPLRIVYGGSTPQRRYALEVVPWHEVAEHRWD